MNITVGTVVKHMVYHYGANAKNFQHKPPEIHHGIVTKVYEKQAAVRFKRGGQNIIKKCDLTSLEAEQPIAAYEEGK